MAVTECEITGMASARNEIYHLHRIRNDTIERAGVMKLITVSTFVCTVLCCGAAQAVQMTIEDVGLAPFFQKGRRPVDDNITHYCSTGGLRRVPVPVWTTTQRPDVRSTADDLITHY